MFCIFWKPGEFVSLTLEGASESCRMECNDPPNTRTGERELSNGMQRPFNHLRPIIPGKNECGTLLDHPTESKPITEIQATFNGKFDISIACSQIQLSVMYAVAIRTRRWLVGAIPGIGPTVVGG